MAFFELAALDLFSILHLDCIKHTGYRAKLLVSTTIPLLPLALVFGHKYFKEW